jgi:pimeloyl-ACP methyl ester carboxylesterase
MPGLRKSIPAAVCIHGAGGGGWEWAIWQRVFAARGWSVVAPDLMPGRGGLAATTFEDYAAQVRAWCEPCDTQQYVLIGASLGGLLALHVAGGIEPAALVLVNPLPPAGISPRPSRTDFPDIVPWGRERSLDSTRRAMPDADDAARLFAFKRWRDESGAVLRAAAQGIALTSVRCPMLILASENDTDVGADASRALATHCAAEFRLLKGASHVGPLLGRSANAVAADVLGWCWHVIARGKV